MPLLFNASVAIMKTVLKKNEFYVLTPCQLPNHFVFLQVFKLTFYPRWGGRGEGTGQDDPTRTFISIFMGYLACLPTGLYQN